MEDILLNLQDLIYFKHLSESLSFTETAEHFFVSQPSISTALKRLESEFGTMLVDRRKTLKKIQLTTAGKILYQNTTEALNILDSTKQKIHDLESETVYYGFLPTIGGYLMPRILPKLSRFTQTIKFIEEESSDVMLQMVKDGEVPIAIIGYDAPQILDNKIRQIRVENEEMALWVSPDHPLAEKKEVDVEDVKNEVFISLSEGYTHQRIFEQWTKSHRLDEPDVVYAREIKTALSIAASTQMVAFMSEIIVDDTHDLVKVTLKNAPKFYISLILNTHADNTICQQEFNEAVIQAVHDEFVEGI